MPAVPGGAMITPDPNIDIKADSVANPMEMIMPPATVHPLNDPRPDPMKDKRIAAFKRKVLRNGLKEPKLKKDIPMPDNLPKIASPDGREGGDATQTPGRAVETATSHFSLSRQLFLEGRHAESFDLFQRAMAGMEVAAGELAGDTDMALRTRVHALLASAFDPNTGTLLASADLDSQLELALDAVAASGDGTEATMQSATKSNKPSPLQELAGMLDNAAKRVSPLREFAASVGA